MMRKVPNGTPLLVSSSSSSTFIQDSNNNCKEEDSSDNSNNDDDNDNNINCKEDDDNNNNNNDDNTDNDNDNDVYISVASFNLLAPIYVQRPTIIDNRSNTGTTTIPKFATAFDWISSSEDSSKILDIKFRGPRLLKAIQSCQADVICLQELQLELHPQQQQQQQNCSSISSKSSSKYQLPLWIQPLLMDSSDSDSLSYEIHLPPETELDNISNRNFKVLNTQTPVVCAILIKKHLKYSTMKWNDNNTCVSVCITIPTKRKPSSSSINDEQQDNNRQEEEEEEEVVSNNNDHIDHDHDHKVVVSCIHLDAKDETKRVIQLTRCLHRVRDFFNNDDDDVADANDATTTTSCNNKEKPTTNNTIKLKGRVLSMIIAGDFNTNLNLGSCCRAFLTCYAPTDDDGGDQPITITTQEDMERECSSSASALRLSLLSSSKYNKKYQPIIPTKQQQLTDWNNLYLYAQNKVNDEFCTSLNRINTGTTRSAYDHNVDYDYGDDYVYDNNNNNNTNTNNNIRKKVMAQWKLDHIVYSTETLEPIKYWSTLEDDIESCQIGLPNLRIGSDHLPVGALFRLKQPPKLTQQQQDDLLNQLSKLVQKQKSEIQLQEKEFDEQLKIIQDKLEAQQLQLQQQNHDDNKEAREKEKEKLDMLDAKFATLPFWKKKWLRKKQKYFKNPNYKKKKKVPPPHPLIVELFRQKRSTINEIKSRQQKERADIVENFDNLQRLFIQRQYNMIPSKWIEKGCVLEI